jgi:hypothetical protein
MGANLVGQMLGDIHAVSVECCSVKISYVNRRWLIRLRRIITLRVTTAFTRLHMSLGIFCDPLVYMTTIGASPFCGNSANIVPASSI